jgi:hypothetical protein
MCGAEPFSIPQMFYTNIVHMNINELDYVTPNDRELDELFLAFNL